VTKPIPSWPKRYDW